MHNPVELLLSDLYPSEAHLADPLACGRLAELQLGQPEAAEDSDHEGHCAAVVGDYERNFRLLLDVAPQYLRVVVVDLLQQVVLKLVRIDLRGGKQCKQVRDGEHIGQHDEVLELHGLVSEEMAADRVLLWEPLREFSLHVLIRVYA